MKYQAYEDQFGYGFSHDDCQEDQMKARELIKLLEEFAVCEACEEDENSEGENNHEA